ncbi:MAG TPA: 23S rRNA (pseudouridine(1915)-N(3))-methyltransferase RlmH [Saprospiraceae bacterium]|nr:23S rRNA (pseudouridine(1915)-N(3))-methyltransferase RlmH [Saprospiraceae bacterium]
MKIELWLVGKTNKAYLKDGMDIYQKRIGKYIPFQMEIIPDIKSAKNLSALLLKKKEGERILSKIDKKDCLILLDENGKQFTSEAFAKYFEQQLQSSFRKIIFLIGGAYGFSEEVYQRANFKIAVSKMTFSHQMVRLFFLEQLYRAMTILRNEPYHNV